MAESPKPNLWGREPLMILGVLQAALVVALAFGLEITEAQQNGLLGLAATLLGVSYAGRSQVYPAQMVEAKLTERQLTKLEKPIDG